MWLLTKLKMVTRAETALMSRLVLKFLYLTVQAQMGLSRIKIQYK